MKSYLMILLILIGISVNGQNSLTGLPPKNFYPNAIITLKDFTKYQGKGVNIMKDSILFTDKLNMQNNRLAISKIEYIRVQEGNQGLKWLGLGALTFGLSAVLAVYDYPDTPNKSGLIIGFTVSGAVIGSLVGLAIPKWKTYYLKR